MIVMVLIFRLGVWCNRIFLLYWEEGGGSGVLGLPMPRILLLSSPVCQL
jgi:hypothetical protein